MFYHPATKTLIVTDLVFNLRNTIGLLAPITYRLVGIHNRFTASRFWPKLTDDTNMVRESLNEILRLDFDRLVMAHGKILTKDAKSKLAEALKARSLI